jgi:CubicO group peptidase (beta-lactamase class C family)
MVDNLLEKTQQLINAYNQSNSFSGVIEVVVDGEPRFQTAMGIVNEEHQVPMTMDSVFPIGSNTKLFTAVALYQLQEQGKVNLSQPINDDLTQDDFVKFGFPNQTSWCPQLQDMPNGTCIDVTYEQLLSMSSGIGDNPKDYEVYTGEYMGTVGVYVGLFINDPLIFTPGTNFSYSNPSFILATYMIEKLSGLKYQDYLKRNIFEPLNLQSSYYQPYDGQLSIIKNYADQYWKFYANDTGEELDIGVCHYFSSSGAISGAGGIATTIDDLTKWYLDLFRDRGKASKILSKNSIRKIVKPWILVSEDSMLMSEVDALYYGQGVLVSYPNGVASFDWPTEIMHGGSTLCATTTIAMHFFDSKCSIIAVAFSNSQVFLFDSRETYEDLKQNLNVSFYELFTDPASQFEDNQWAWVIGGNDGQVVGELLDIWTSAEAS